jgi:hypothetical protein
VSGEAPGGIIAGEPDAVPEGVDRMNGGTGDREWREITRIEVPASARNTDPAHDDRSPRAGPAAALAASATVDARPSVASTIDPGPARDTNQVEQRVAHRTADDASHAARDSADHAWHRARDTAASERVTTPANARMVAPVPAVDPGPRPATPALPTRDAPAALTQAVPAAITRPALVDVMPEERARVVVDAGDQPMPARALPVSPPLARPIDPPPAESHDVRTMAPAVPAPHAPGAHEARTIQVRIGTIEIRTAEAPPTAPAAPPAPAPAIGFADYARVRRYAGWARR